MSKSNVVATKPGRIVSVDFLRGAIMILMALDHIKFFLIKYDFVLTDLSKTTTSLFLARWVTNFCAPIFMFLIGIGMSIAFSRGKPKKQIAVFLLTRGLFLVLLELTFMHFTWTFNLNLTTEVFAALWAIGWSMIALSGLIFLPGWLILIIGFAVVGGHNLLDNVHSGVPGGLTFFWNTLHVQGENVVHWSKAVSSIVYVYYPLIPWIVVPALGYVLGNVYSFEKKKRIKWLLTIGSVCIVLFVIIRAINLYGDPAPWVKYDSLTFTTLSFINCAKYPPSLLFLLMTLGPAIIALALLEFNIKAGITNFFVTFGSVALFYYLAHIVLIHLLAVVISYCRYHSFSWLIGNQGLFGVPFPGAPPGYGYGLAGVFCIWIIVIALLFPLCKWYAGIKRKHRGNIWLSYL